MRYINQVYAQNWIEQLRANHKRLHPERDMRERMEMVDNNGVDVFYWGDTDEESSLWVTRYEKLLPKVFELIR